MLPRLTKAFVQPFSNKISEHAIVFYTTIAHTAMQETILVVKLLQLDLKTQDQSVR